MRNRLQEIFDYFKMDHQKEKLKEECREYLKSQDSGELADLYILSSQIYSNSPEVRREVEYKISRTLVRIENKYYKEESFK